MTRLYLQFDVWDKVSPIVRRELFEPSNYILQSDSEVFVTLRLGPLVDRNRFATSLARKFAARIMWVGADSPYLSAFVPKNSLLEIAAMPEVQYVHHTPHIQSHTPIRPLFETLGNVNRVMLSEVREALGVQGDGLNSHVGIIDSGVSKEYSDHVVEAKSYVDNDPFYDDTGHGTATANIVGYINPQVRLHIVKAFTQDQGDAASVMRAMETLAAEGIPIISCSFGVEQYPPIDETVDILHRKYGTLFPVSAGNNGPFGHIMSPAASPGAIAVGSVALRLPTPLGVSSFSARGPSYTGLVKPDFVAFGGSEGECIQTVSGCWKGTSFSAPEVAGLLSLIPGGAEERVSRLAQHVISPMPGKSNDIGWGVPVFSGEEGRAVEVVPVAAAPPLDSGAVALALSLGVVGYYVASRTGAVPKLL